MPQSLTGNGSTSLAVNFEPKPQTSEKNHLNQIDQDNRKDLTWIERKVKGATMAERIAHWAVVTAARVRILAIKYPVSFMNMAICKMF